MLDDAAPLWLGMLDGLAYAHRATLRFESADGTHKTAHGIVHRNLKPHNILLASQERTWIPKITDFGLAKSFAIGRVYRYYCSWRCTGYSCVLAA